MPQKNGLDKLVFNEMNILSKSISEIEPFFKEIACLDDTFAEYLVYCEAYENLFPEDKNFNTFLKTAIKPLFKKLGMAKWKRDVLTEMGLKLGEDQKAYSFKDGKLTFKGQEDNDNSDEPTE